MIVRDRCSCSDGILNLFLFEVLMMMMLEWLRFFLCNKMTCYAALRIGLVFNHQSRVYNVTLPL
ncbi:hypothetical protein NC653_008221 [Populus alba x Populus x berolinensis]|uniref:Uncharacterized protein n=1 Tax=Populus alba x Populus x berolinensis TaxID=444605 RepID=A0AAD6W849_9ROSI|nr:hypothetical protein NC653_008221 [Populus alba x Populus x berolinensis]